MKVQLGRNIADCYHYDLQRWFWNHICLRHKIVDHIALATQRVPIHTQHPISAITFASSLCDSRPTRRPSFGLGIPFQSVNDKVTHWLHNTRGGALWIAQAIVQNTFLVRRWTWFVQPEVSLGLSRPFPFARVVANNQYAVLSRQCGVNDYSSDPQRRRAIPCWLFANLYPETVCSVGPVWSHPTTRWMPVLPLSLSANYSQIS